MSSWPSSFDSPASVAPATASMGALPPVAGAASNAVPRTVMTFTASVHWTVAMALPA